MKRYTKYEDIIDYAVKVKELGVSKGMGNLPIFDFNGDVDLKVQYVHECMLFKKSGRYIKNLIATLKSIREYEELLGKDLYEFNLEESIDMYKSRSFKTLSSLRSFRSFITGYLRFSIIKERVMTSKCCALHMTNEEVKLCVPYAKINSIYVTQEEYEEILRKTSAPCDRLLLMLIWKGMHDRGLDRIRNIKINDVDLSSRQITSGGITIDFTKEEFEDVRSAIMLESYGTKFRAFYDSIYLFKEIDMCCSRGTAPKLGFLRSRYSNK